MIVDGKQIAADVRAQLRAEAAAFGRPLKLGLLRSGTDVVAQKYVAMKARTARELCVKVVEIPLSEAPSTEEALAALRRLAQEVDGIIVQMPLPKPVDAAAVVCAIPPELDVDLLRRDPDHELLAPVTAAIREILERGRVTLAGKRAVVVGSGRLVGAPSAAWLRAAGAHVALSTLETNDLAERAAEADILVLGAGRAGMITPRMLKPGVVLIDAGTSELGGQMRGDADPACAGVASLFTPVPGGVGPVAVAMIFKNLLVLARRRERASR